MQRGPRRSALSASGRSIPSQIAIANEVFSPTADEITQARLVVAAVRDAEAAGSGAASVDGRMIDAATARIFQTVLDRAASISGKMIGQLHISD